MVWDFDPLSGRLRHMREAGVSVVLGGGIAGITSGSALGKELAVGRNFRIALGGNRGSGRFHKRHYHRRITDERGIIGSGGGINWHCPWQKGW